MIDTSLPDQAPPLSNRLLREFAALWILFCGGFACLAYARGQLTSALIFATLAIALGPIGLVKPQLIRPVYVLLTTITYPVGWVISHMLLALLYYCVFTPFGLAFRLLGRDALCRHKRPESRSYWTPKAVPEDVQGYFRQS